MLVAIYATTGLRRSGLVRASAAIGLGALLGLGAMSIVRPDVTTATLPTDIVPLTQAAFQTSVGTGVDVDTPATISFSTAMERASVEAALTVEPSTPIALRWSDDDTTVTIVPVGHWAVGTYHTITVQPGALARTGRPLTTPARSAFLTRGPATATVGATERLEKRVAVGTAFTIAFDRPIDPATVEGGGPARAVSAWSPERGAERRGAAAVHLHADQGPQGRHALPPPRQRRPRRGWGRDRSGIDGGSHVRCS